ncbi:hypothetical protein C8Q75DRAFT_759961 [Abortiporus biennis]|nr:hypothetical protein C8Q75DRAFT_759961 [Abortiporus biennis]
MDIHTHVLTFILWATFLTQSLILTNQKYFTNAITLIDLYPFSTILTTMFFLDNMLHLDYYCIRCQLRLSFIYVDIVQSWTGDTQSIKDTQLAGSWSL